jgi:hypothetical protein
MPLTVNQEYVGSTPTLLKIRVQFSYSPFLFINILSCFICHISIAVSTLDFLSSSLSSILGCGIFLGDMAKLVDATDLKSVGL